MIVKYRRRVEFYTHVVATTPEDSSSCRRIWRYGERSFPSMRTASFWGFFTSGRHSRGRRSDLLKLPNIYLPSQPIWFTDDSSDEWKPGYIESKDITPDSYWITNDKNNRRLRRNKHDIKPRYITVTQQRPKPHVPVRYPAHVSDDDAASITTCQ